ncbi:MAG: Stress responsive Barrel Domain-containing protein [Ilumatobacteraceae bacterium]|nr:Stress responsive Barrel Domain-containing protein [Ilumatobacteraceae bacterium]
MITHIAAFRWKPETTAEQIEAITAGLATMPANVPSIRTYAFGSDLGANGDLNMDFAVVATFDSVEGWRAYDEHPHHVTVRSETIRPWIAERASVQFPS